METDADISKYDKGYNGYSNRIPLSVGIYTDNDSICQLSAENIKNIQNRKLHI